MTEKNPCLKPPAQGGQTSVAVADGNQETGTGETARQKSYDNAEEYASPKWSLSDTELWAKDLYAAPVTSDDVSLDVGAGYAIVDELRQINKMSLEDLVLAAQPSSQSGHGIYTLPYVRDVLAGRRTPDVVWVFCVADVFRYSPSDLLRAFELPYPQRPQSDAVTREAIDWSDDKEARRVELIEKEHSGHDLTAEERGWLTALQTERRRYVNVLYPYPGQ